MITATSPSSRTIFCHQAQALVILGEKMMYCLHIQDVTLSKSMQPARHAHTAEELAHGNLRGK